MEIRGAKLLGRYEIVGELGHGAMGVVYKARDPKIDRFVAIKTISLVQANSQEQQEFRQRFFLEAQAAGRLLHPGIVAVFDLGEEPVTSDPYIVMEYIEGQTLKDLLAGLNEKLPLANALKITQEIAEGLDYAHGQNVVHRDIKPANILITKDGQAKISDFGIAQLDFTNLTMTGKVVGTPAFMSPEQLEGAQVDGRSDIFSLGAILYLMVTGFSPFQGNSAMTICFKITNRDPLQPTALSPELPPELDAVIGRALAKDPAQRYARAAEFAADLRALLGKIVRQGDPAKATLWFSEAQDRPKWLDGINETGLHNKMGPITSRQPARKGESAFQQQIQQGVSSLMTALHLPALETRTLVGTVAALLVVGITAMAFILRQDRSSAPVNSASGARSAPATIAELHAPTSELQVPRAAAASGNGDQPQVSGAANAANSGPKSAPPVAQKKTGASLPSAAGGGHAKSSNPPTMRTDTQKQVTLKTASAVAPQTAAAASAPVAKPAVEQLAVADSNVELEIEDRFADAVLSLWVDNRLEYEHPLRTGAKKHLALFGKAAKETVTIPVSAGDHELRVRVQSNTEQYEEAKTISGSFAKSGLRVLTINFEKRTKEILLAFR